MDIKKKENLERKIKLSNKKSVFMFLMKPYGYLILVIIIVVTMIYTAILLDKYSYNARKFRLSLLHFNKNQEEMITELNRYNFSRNFIPYFNSELEKWNKFYKRRLFQRLMTRKKADEYFNFVQEIQYVFWDEQGADYVCSDVKKATENIKALKNTLSELKADDKIKLMSLLQKCIKLSKKTKKLKTVGNYSRAVGLIHEIRKEIDAIKVELEQYNLQIHIAKKYRWPSEKRFFYSCIIFIEELRSNSRIYSYVKCYSEMEDIWDDIQKSVSKSELIISKGYSYKNYKLLEKNNFNIDLLVKKFRKQASFIVKNKIKSDMGDCPINQEIDEEQDLVIDKIYFPTVSVSKIPSKKRKIIILVSVVISSDGKIMKKTINQTSGSEELDKIALDAVEKFKLKINLKTKNSKERFQSIIPVLIIGVE